MARALVVKLPKQDTIDATWLTLDSSRDRHNHRLIWHTAGKSMIGRLTRKWEIPALNRF
jgi:hypothetical protein